MLGARKSKALKRTANIGLGHLHIEGEDADHYIYDEVHCTMK